MTAFASTARLRSGTATGRRTLVRGYGRVTVSLIYAYGILSRYRDSLTGKGGCVQQQGSEDQSGTESKPAGSTLSKLEHLVVVLARRLWDEARDKDSKDWPPAWLVFAAVATGLGVVLLIVVPIVRKLLFACGSAITAMGGWTHDQAYVQIVLAPVHSYLNTHAGGLPVSAETLWWTWCIAGPAMLTASLLRWVAGRVGWVFFGLGTAAMVGSGTSSSGRWIAVGAMGIWWVLLSIPALTRRRPSPAVNIYPPPTRIAEAEPELAPAAQAEDDVEAVVEQPVRDDYAAWAASIHERLLRREERAPTAATTAWTAVATGPTTFTAGDGSREVCGIVINGEAAEDLLAQLSKPVGARPVVRWTTGPMRTPRSRRITDEGYQGPPSLVEFVRSSTDMLETLKASVTLLRERWHQGDIDEQIIGRAELLNRIAPLISVSVDYVPGFTDDHYLGEIAFNDWVDLDTVVGGNASSWNDFSSHRPKVVGLIIRKLLSAEDPAAAAAEIMTDLGHAHLSRYDGPAGPIYSIADNGTHRTHALRILGVPALAAEVHLQALPLRIDAMSTWGEGSWGENYEGPADDMWRALRERRLLSGAILGRGSQAVLEPYQAVAPWLLGGPRDAATISAAYERIYPGSLGIPATAMAGPDPWLRWLFDKSGR